MPRMVQTLNRTITPPLVAILESLKLKLEVGIALSISSNVRTPPLGTQFCFCSYYRVCHRNVQHTLQRCSLKSSYRENTKTPWKPEMEA